MRETLKSELQPIREHRGATAVSTRASGPSAWPKWLARMISPPGFTTRANSVRACSGLGTSVWQSVLAPRLHAAREIGEGLCGARRQRDKELSRAPVEALARIAEPADVHDLQTAHMRKPALEDLRSGSPQHVFRQVDPIY